MNLRNLVTWTLAGALFGVVFGLIASIFQGGPSAQQGIRESWLFFAVVGFLKAYIDPVEKIPSKQNAAGRPDSR